jgi:hypothetical protein
MTPRGRSRHGSGGFSYLHEFERRQNANQFARRVLHESKRMIPWRIYPCEEIRNLRSGVDYFGVDKQETIARRGLD